jgi:hypothetical protein
MIDRDMSGIGWRSVLWPQQPGSGEEVEDFSTDLVRAMKFTCHVCSPKIPGGYAVSRA